MFCGTLPQFVQKFANYRSISVIKQKIKGYMREARQKRADAADKLVMEERYAYYKSLSGEVAAAISRISALQYGDCINAKFLENELIPSLGLNNENLNEQPPELAPYFGRGLHLWQYPPQLANYLVWLAQNAREVKKYMEIGCRWGGTFILTTEWLKKIGAPLECAIAVDPINPTPFVDEYIKLNKDVPIKYLQMMSNSQEFKNYFDAAKPDMVFIDGDHSMRGVMNDHLMARTCANIIGHHDISSQYCADTTMFWQYVKQAETEFNNAEFIDQYNSVNGSYLGIGVLKRK
jgi:hypothetical protein